MTDHPSEREDFQVVLSYFTILSAVGSLVFASILLFSVNGVFSSNQRLGVAAFASFFSFIIFILLMFVLLFSRLNQALDQIREDIRSLNK